MQVDRLERGMRLGKNIYGTRGDVLLARGTILSNEYLTKLRERGFHFAYVLRALPTTSSRPASSLNACARQTRAISRRFTS